VNLESWLRNKLKDDRARLWILWIATHIVAVFVGIEISAGFALAILGKDPSGLVVGICFAPLYGAPGLVMFMRYASPVLTLLTGAAFGLIGGTILILSQELVMKKSSPTLTVASGALGWCLAGMLASMLVYLPPLRSTEPPIGNFLFLISPLNLAVGTSFGLGAGFFSTVFRRLRPGSGWHISPQMVAANTIGWGVAGAIAFTVNTVLGFILAAIAASLITWPATIKAESLPKG
jgi:hypothetical protein